MIFQKCLNYIYQNFQDFWNIHADKEHLKICAFATITKSTELP